MPDEPKKACFFGLTVPGPNSLPTKAKVEGKHPLPFLLNHIGNHMFVPQQNPPQASRIVQERNVLVFPRPTKSIRIPFKFLKSAKIQKKRLLLRTILNSSNSHPRDRAKNYVSLRNALAMRLRLWEEFKTMRDWLSIIRLGCKPEEPALRQGLQFDSSSVPI
jgi:hypothetical protein